MRDYHDHEWGTPTRDERTLFEFLILESAQAGLSWRTVLERREAYRKAYMDFDPGAVAGFLVDDVDRLMLAESGVIRHRRKIEASVSNALCFLRIQYEFGGFANYLWKFVDGETIHNQFSHLSEVPTHTPISERLSRDLRKRGMHFVGSVICYAYMQAIGLVNDHLLECARGTELRERDLQRKDA